MKLLTAILGCALWWALSASCHAQEGTVTAETYEVGVAAIDITPEHPIRLNGFGSRRDESAGVRQKIWAKALAIGSDEQGPALLITVEVLGIPDALANELAESLAKTTAVRREKLALTATHTHTGPMLASENETLFGVPIPAEHLAHIRDYTKVFKAKLKQVALAALADRKPARLAWGIGTVGFAQNRRTAGGPVDHDFPILTARSLNGDLRAVYVSYACHCVTLSDNQISGDWAGYAIAAIERDHPGAIALCSVGCGADSNPSSGVVGDRADIATAQGEEIATEVERLLGGFLAPVHGEISASLDRVTLPLQELPKRAEWEQRAKEESAIGHHARTQLARLDRGEKLIDHIDAPVQSWQFGDSLAMVFLPGETVVDYSLRLKQELDASRLWINGYANAAPGYVPSERILREGGYEGGGAMIYYDIPMPYARGLEQKLVDAVHNQLGDTFAAKVSTDRTNGVPPLSPQQSAAKIQTRPELQAQLMLAEPLVVDPVAIDFAPDGSLWVAEMHDYPSGVAGDYQPGGRVRLVRDTNGDGTYDTATVFLDDIPFPTGVTSWRGGVLICSAPDIRYAEDTDGDGRADINRVLYSGFGTDNYQGRVNSLEYGLDGWVYGSCGLFGGQITSFAATEPYALGDRDFRIKPDTGEIEPATGRTQQGRVRDDWGNWFGCDNSTLLIHYPLADHDLRRNPYLSGAPASVSLAPSNQLFPVVPPLRFKLSGPAGLTTAACGLGIYRDQLLGQDFTGNSFTCEPVSQVAHRLRLLATGATFAAQRAAGEEQSEFLASSDGWFRPVQAKTGPDGALWVVDMYRYIIEHPRWIPEEDAARVDLRAGETMGRIYRIVPRDNRPREIVHLDELDAAGLVAALDSPNGPQRDLAGQLLVWRNDRAAIPALLDLLERSERAEARLHALTLLDGFQALSTPSLQTAFRDPHAGVRSHAARIAGERIAAERELLADVLPLISDHDAQVRLQAVMSLGNADDPRAATGLVQLAMEHADDPFSVAAVNSSLSAKNVQPTLRAALATGDALPPALFMEQLMTVAAATDAKDALAEAVAACTRQKPGEKGLVDWQTSALAQVLRTLSQRSLRLDDAIGTEASKLVADALVSLRTSAANDELESARRLAALAVLGQSREHAATDLNTLRRMLVPREPVTIQLAVVEALGRIEDEDSLRTLLRGWPTASPQLQGAIFDVIVSRPAWLPELMSKFADGEFASSSLDAARIARLMEHPSEPIRAQAAEIFAASVSKDRRAVLERYAQAVQREGDFDRGQLVFEKNCAACHRLRDVGHVVGPDLAPLSSKTREYLLQATLDPNGAVDSRYVSYIIELRDGRVLTGIIADESGGSLTLAMQDGKQQAILRSEIEDLRTTGKSLMPEGVEKDLSVQDVADLLKFLQSSGPGSPVDQD